MHDSCWSEMDMMKIHEGYIILKLSEKRFWVLTKLWQYISCNITNKYLHEYTMYLHDYHLACEISK